MRVPQSPHTLRKFVSTSSSSDSETETNSDSEKMKLPPKQPFNKNGSNKKELRHEKPVTNNKLTSFSSHRSRERTRISAVQRLVERKMAQKEKDREKARWLQMNYYAWKMWATRSQCFSPQTNNQHSWQLKKSKSWGPFWSYQLNSTVNSAHFAQFLGNGAKLAVLFSL